MALEQPWKVIMKTATLVIISFILLGACGQLKNMAPEQINKVGQEQLDRRVVQSIKEHYHLTYGEGTRLEEFAEAAATELTYTHIPDNDDEKEGVIVTIAIPLTKGRA